MSSRVCSHCGCSDIDVDAARGDAVCTNCGSVLEEQIIVSEVQFEDTGKGGSSVIGQFVSSEGNKTPNLGTSFHHGMGKESRAITLQNGKRKIQHVGNQLRLNQHCIDTAFNFFKMAVTARLTRGRKTTHVVAACLYLVCRTEGTPHMLLDFSDVLQVNVYSLGRTYLQLSKELCINIPVLDPCLYIQRFAHHLEFEGKTHEVSMTALRLVSRMKRDWIAQGRRPSGLCGAALLVAARIHNFNRTLKQVLKVVRVSETTIRKRLKEFGETPSGQLTVEEFHNIDLEAESDPPSFTEGKRRAKLQLLEDDGKLPELTSEISNVQAEIEKALEDSRPKRRGPYANLDKPPPSPSPSPSINSEDTASACEQFIESEILTDALDYASQNDETQKDQVKAKLEKLDSDSEIIPSKSVSESDSSYTNFVKCDNQSKTHLDGDRLQQQDFDSALMPPPWSSKEEGGASSAGLRPTAASLGLKESIEECLRVDEKTDHELEDGELDLTGIDDAELDVFILTPEEAARKTEVWMKFNAAYLQEQKEKEEKEAKEREAGGKQEKKKRKYKKKTPIQASTAGEAIEKIIQERRISNKINYDVLKDLREQEQVPVKKKDPEPILSKIQVVGAVTLKSTTDKRFRKSSISLETKSEPEEPPAKKMALEQAPSGGMQEVIVETGPVEYIKEDPGYDEEEDAADYYEEDEEHVSAAQLLGHHVEEDEGDMYDDYMD